MSTPCQLFFLYDSTLDAIEAGLNRQDRWSPPETLPQADPDQSQQHLAQSSELWPRQPPAGPIWLP